MGFLAIRDINSGDEVVWDYLVQDPEVSWAKSKLVSGVVRAAEAAGVTAEECEHRMDQKGKSPAASRRFCFCPLGCPRPVKKLSNHLGQVHHLTPKERQKYLRQKRKFARAGDIQQKTVQEGCRKSQRIESFFISRAPGKHHDKPDEEQELGIDKAIDLDEEGAQEEPGSVGVQINVDNSDEPGPSTDLQFTVEGSGNSSPSYPPTEPCLLPGPSPDLPFTIQGSRNISSYPPTEPCLLEFASYLGSRIGGKKSARQVGEIVADVGKYLWFADEVNCDINNCLKSKTIRKYADYIEAKLKIGPSGIISKLMRIKMALEMVELESEDSPEESTVVALSRKAKETISRLCAPLRKEKYRKQASKLEEFSSEVPDLGEVRDFLEDEKWTRFIEKVAYSVTTATVDEMKKAMVVVAGRLMLR